MSTSALVAARYTCTRRKEYSSTFVAELLAGVDRIRILRKRKFGLRIAACAPLSEYATNTTCPGGARIHDIPANGFESTLRTSPSNSGY